jgi:putative FmdB family regulatory protein
MPTYDYVCDACDHKFELFQGITEPVKKKCPACQKPKLRRLFGTGAAIVFKGSGFYQTDYRSESYKKSAQADKPPSSGDSGSSSSDAKSSSGSNGSTTPAASSSSSESKPAKKESKSKKD